MAQESKNAVVKSESKKQKPKKEKRESWLGRKIKDTYAELKKVTWPTFPVVVKSIGVVFAVTAIFLVVLLGFDLLLTYFAYNPLTTGTIAGKGEEAFGLLTNFGGALGRIVRGIGS